jgi:dolichyl-phosphate-mannose--protein O-mannosyl transferase
MVDLIVSLRTTLLLFISLATALSEFESVTCGSMIKLKSKATRHRLFSQTINYSGGSGQQSVTALGTSSDPGSYFYVDKVKGCKRGSVIKCQSQVILTHQQTGKRLHSHMIARYKKCLKVHYLKIKKYLHMTLRTLVIIG